MKNVSFLRSQNAVDFQVMTDEMAVRYMSQVPDESIAEPNESSFNNDLVNNSDNVYCQPDDNTQVKIQSLKIWTTGKLEIWTEFAF